MGRVAGGVVGTVFVLISSTAGAAAQVPTGTIIGVVADASKSVLPGVTVTVVSTALPGGPVTSTTDERDTEHELRHVQLFQRDLRAADFVGPAAAIVSGSTPEFLTGRLRPDRCSFPGAPPVQLDPTRLPRRAEWPR